MENRKIASQCVIVTKDTPKRVQKHNKVQMNQGKNANYQCANTVLPSNQAKTNYRRLPSKTNYHRLSLLLRCSKDMLLLFQIASYPKITGL